MSQVEFDAINSKPTIDLTQDQQEALVETDFIQGPSVVSMSIELYRGLMDLTSDDDLAASLRAITRGLDDAAAGRARPFREVLADLG